MAWQDAGPIVSGNAGVLAAAGIKHVSRAWLKEQVVARVLERLGGSKE